MVDFHVTDDKVINEQSDKIAKYTIKDSVFTDLFKIKKYLLQMYQTLHPEDNTVTEDDFTHVTIQNILTDQQYNDLGMLVEGKSIILTECQTTWSMNIIVRSFLYLAKTFQDYIDENELDAYGSKKIPLPKPELYVLYIGDRKTRPETIRLSEEFFSSRQNENINDFSSDNHEVISDKEEFALEVTIKMLYGEKDGKDIISQYVAFSHIYDEQRRLHGRTRKAVEETIRICVDKDILKEYLESRKKEVVSIMMTLFDEETIRKNREASIAREAAREATRETEEKGIEALVEAYQSFNATFNATVKKVMEAFNLDEMTSSMRVSKYWK